MLLLLSPKHLQSTIGNITRALPPQLLKQMGGAAGLQQIMKSMDGKQLGGGGDDDAPPRGGKKGKK